MTPPPTPVIAVIASERSLIEQLRQQRATVPERAIPLDDLRWMQARRHAALARVGAIEVTPGGRWYLNEPIYSEYVSRRRRMVVIAAIAALLAALTVSVLYP